MYEAYRFLLWKRKCRPAERSSAYVGFKSETGPGKMMTALVWERDGFLDRAVSNPKGEVQRTTAGIRKASQL